MAWRGARIECGVGGRNGDWRAPQRHEDRRCRLRAQHDRRGTGRLPGAELIDQLTIDLVVAREQVAQPVVRCAIVRCVLSRML